MYIQIMIIRVDFVTEKESVKNKSINNGIMKTTNIQKMMQNLCLAWNKKYQASKETGKYAPRKGKNPSSESTPEMT